MTEWTATNYAVVYSPDLKHLVKEVQKLVTEGWKPQGGIASTDTGLYQAMVDSKVSPYHLLDFFRTFMTVKVYGHLQPGANRHWMNNLPGAAMPAVSAVAAD